MSIWQKIKSGQLYYCTDENVLIEQLKCLDVVYDFNNARPSELDERHELLHKVFSTVGTGVYIEPPLHANWGRNTHVGNNVYANFNLTLVDDTDIHIGDNVMIGPNVTLATGTHPIHPELRRKVAQFNLPVVIEDNVRSEERRVGKER